MREFHTIVEFAFNEKKETYTVRFLDGTCLKVPIKHLPAKYQLKTAKWEQTEIGKNKDCLTVSLGKKTITIPAFVLYSSGRAL